MATKQQTFWAVVCKGAGVIVPSLSLTRRDVMKHVPSGNPYYKAVKVSVIYEDPFALTSAVGDEK